MSALLLAMPAEITTIDDLRGMESEDRIRRFGDTIELIISVVAGRQFLDEHMLPYVMEFLCMHRFDKIAMACIDTIVEDVVKHRVGVIPAITYMQVPKIAVIHNRIEVLFYFYKSLPIAANASIERDHEHVQHIVFHSGMFERFDHNQLVQLNNENQYVLWWAFVGFMYTNNIAKAIELLRLFIGDHGIVADIDAAIENASYFNDAMAAVQDYTARYFEDIEHNVAGGEQ